MLPNTILRVVIFDCCNNSIITKSNCETEASVLKNFVIIFDFEGELLINSGKRGQSSFCRSNNGSECSLLKFSKSYSQTIDIVRGIVLLQ